MQSLVPSLSLNNLIPLTTFFSVVFLTLDETIPLRIDKNRTPRIGKNKTLPDWDPFRLAKLGPLGIGKNKTPPDWDPSGFVKIASRRLSKFSPDTLPDTFSDAFMLFE